ncbi:hypothetical protein [Paremcibacter congregatus]|uniref:hypothetical protein n=1 Tax=Paremcibacter congregatus TaxID=2043170 RepID=UPI001123B3C5|nr:hypothetical protein [Paremcibacter congregatus]QDE27273.1 hypothetical protein FIV45_08235 [Paremcibacter congregatus]
MLHEGTLQPGEWRTIGAGAHSQIFIMECDLEYIEVKFKNLSKFRMYRGVPAKYNFDNVDISNPHSTPIDYKIYTAPAGMEFQEGRSIETGTSIIGTVGTVGRPLSDEGGSVASIGSVNLELERTGVYTEVVVSKAANTNGIFLRTALIQQSVSGNINILSDRAAGGSTILLLSQLAGDALRLSREIFIPSGNGLTLYFGGGATAYINVSYDVL